jgi:hypothetical protein
MTCMEIWEDRQINPVADEVGALVAVTGPIIAPRRSCSRWKNRELRS